MSEKLVRPLKWLEHMRLGMAACGAWFKLGLLHRRKVALSPKIVQFSGRLDLLWTNGFVVFPTFLVGVANIARM
ncbi:hypothetical protein C1J03_13505 [Sulfitobacter sp. SK012]|nr:hypothetical protein C1J03_13505 [Sulfitobacter sp. SK012]